MAGLFKKVVRLEIARVGEAFMKNHKIFYWLVKGSNRILKGASRLIGSVLPKESDQSQMKWKRVGSKYGGWWIPRALLDENSIVYCVGAGVDVSFDIELAEIIGCQVFTFDPSPQSVEFMPTIKLPPKMRFFPVGLSDQDGVLTFFFDVRNSQLSMYDVDSTGRTIELPVKRLSTLQSELGHDRVDVLKIDIEGGWRSVLDDVLRSTELPKVLLVEMDTPVRPWTVLRTYRQLAGAGYRLHRREVDNYAFVLE